MTYQIFNYVNANSVNGSSYTDVKISLANNAVARNKKANIGDIALITNNQNSLVQVARIISESDVQYWTGHTYQFVYNVEFLATDVLVEDDARRNLFLNEDGVHTQWATTSAIDTFAKKVLEATKVVITDDRIVETNEGRKYFRDTYGTSVFMDLANKFGKPSVRRDMMLLTVNEFELRYNLTRSGE